MFHPEKADSWLYPYFQLYLYFRLCLWFLVYSFAFRYFQLWWGC